MAGKSVFPRVPRNFISGEEITEIARIRIMHFLPNPSELRLIKYTTPETIVGCTDDTKDLDLLWSLSLHLNLQVSLWDGLCYK